MLRSQTASTCFPAAAISSFRCHDGGHNAKDGKSITQDCNACHNLLAMDEAAPKILTDLGVVESKTK